MHVVHISSVHNANDPRIYLKQLTSVAGQGWKATLITGDPDATNSDSIRVIRVSPGNSKRNLRLLITSPKAILQAFAQDADIYHIHDPELVPWALLLRIKGRPVVYDIHEDYVTSLQQKRYLPYPFRPVAAAVVGLVERLTGLFFYQITAEKYYSRRFPRALPVLNYPALSLLECGDAFSPQSSELLYTGNLTRDRGGLQLARLVRTRPDFNVCAMGYCPAALSAAMRREAGNASGCLHFPGEDRYVLFREILDAYQNRKWLAGLALFPDTEHYREKELTKFFEYMAAGLPVVASDFPAWKRLIADQGVGLCVDPEDPNAIGAALDWLKAHPDKAWKMGARGRKLIKEKYNWEREGEKLIAFYLSLVNKSQPVKL